MSALALARKWRPKSFAQVVGQTMTVRALTNALENDQLHHAYLLTGTRGVGKTTIARILAKCLNCETGITATPCDTCSNCKEVDQGNSLDLIEVDAASRTKVEDTRDLLNNTQFSPTKSRYKVYLIDEVHMLSNHSFNALLKTLEEPPPHVIFLLATTDPQKLPATVLSRCLQFHLLPISPEEINEQLCRILSAEKIENDPAASLLLAQAANGSLRDALSLLDQAIPFCNRKINSDDIKKMLGVIEHDELYKILNAILQKNGNALLSASQSLLEKGVSYQRTLGEMAILLQKLATEQLLPGVQSDFTVPTDYQALLNDLTPEEIQLYYHITLHGQKEITLAVSERSGFEMILLRMLAFRMQEITSTPTSTNSSTLKTTPITDTSTTASIPTSTPTPVSTPSAQSSARSAPTTTADAQALDSIQEWPNLIKQIKLTGAALAVAQQCVIASQTDDEWQLLIDKKHELLLQKVYVDRINDALNQHLGKKIHLVISPHRSGETLATPTELAKAATQKKQNQAENAIQADNNIKKLLQSFDAQIIKDSISANPKDSHTDT